MNNLERRSKGMLYDVFGTGDPAWQKARGLLQKINACKDGMEARPFMEQLLGRYPETASVMVPFYCDLGPNIELGEHAYLNMDCLILDEGKVKIGNHVLIGPRCSIYTAFHPLDPDVRRTGLETARPVTIEDDVWIGGSVVINGGVVIGKGAVIGSGSVVVKSIPAGALAAGCPCRVIRFLDEKDRRSWNEQYEDWQQDPDTK